MTSTIAIEPFDAKFILRGENRSRAWHPCRVVGIARTTCGPWFIAMVRYPDGWCRAEEMHEVFDLDAEMPDE